MSVDSFRDTICTTVITSFLHVPRKIIFYAYSYHFKRMIAEEKLQRVNIVDSLNIDIDDKRRALDCPSKYNVKFYVRSSAGHTKIMPGRSNVAEGREKRYRRIHFPLAFLYFIRFS